MICDDTITTLQLHQTHYTHYSKLDIPIGLVSIANVKQYLGRRQLKYDHSKFHFYF